MDMGKVIHRRRDGQGATRKYYKRTTALSHWPSRSRRMDGRSQLTLKAWEPCRRARPPAFGRRA